MLKFGTTERGDAGICFDWIDRMDEVDAAILITKNLTDKFCEEILKFKSKAILHATITGYGGTILEPKVVDLETSFHQLDRLINVFGFNKDQIVIRMDPIIPNTYFINYSPSLSERVLAYAQEMNLNRIRISFINIYPHVAERLRKINFLQYMLYTTFNCPDFIKYQYLDYISEKYPMHSFELCADISEKEYPNIHQVGCISSKDLTILSLGDKTNQLEYGEPNRKGCLCPKNKIELLDTMKPCAHRCIYCYWRD